MKRKLLAAALISICASCNNGAEIAQLRHDNDSLLRIIGNRHSRLQTAQFVNPAGDTNLISEDLATQYMQSWSNHIMGNSADTSFDSCVAFVVQISEIDSALSLFAANNVTAIAFYLGLKPLATTNGDSQLTLFWTPLTQAPRGTNGNYMALYPSIGTNNFMVFDKTMPCPECGIINPPNGSKVVEDNESKKQNSRK